MADGANKSNNIDFLFPGYLTMKEREESDAYRELKRNTHESVWSARQMCNIPPPAPNWSIREDEAITLLIRDGVKFKKCWNNFLKHALLNRSEAATSGQYYIMKKRDASMDALHCEKNWLFPSTDGASNMERAVRLLRQIRSDNLSTPMQISTIRNEDEYLRLLRKRTFGSFADDESVDGDYSEVRHSQPPVHAAAAQPAARPDTAGVNTLELSALFRARATGQTFVSASGAKY
jgi:hypothetical protein